MKMEQMGEQPSEFKNWKRKTAWFISGQAVSFFGSGITQFAIIWHITLSTASGAMLTISTLCGFLPQILISLFAGVWADRYNRKYIIIIADGMIAFATLIMAIIYIMGYQELWLLFVVLGIRSAGSGIQSPAVSSVIPQIVPQEKLMRVQGINGTVHSMTMLVAPAVSGGLLGIFGMEAAFFLDVVTAVIAICIMFGIDIPRLERSRSLQKIGVLDDLRAGIKLAWNNRFMRTFLSFYAVIMFLITPVAILSPLVIVRNFGSEVWRLTANEIVWSIGMVLGGTAVSVWGGRLKNRMYTMLAGMVAFGVFTAMIGFSTTFTAFLVALFLAGAVMPIIGSSSVVVIQESVEMEMQGRIFGLSQIISSSAVPFATVLFGPLADYMDVGLLIIITGILMTLLSIAAFFDRNIRAGYSGGNKGENKQVFP